jgi:DNA-binding protein HU-beta
MAKVMTKSQVVSHLAEKAGIQKKAAAAVLEELAALATKEAKASGQFVIPGLGKAVKANRKARMGRNPQTLLCLLRKNNHSAADRARSAAPSSALITLPPCVEVPVHPRIGMAGRASSIGQHASVLVSALGVWNLRGAGQGTAARPEVLPRLGECLPRIGLVQTSWFELCARLMATACSG